MSSKTDLPKPAPGSELPVAVIVGLDNITGLQTARILAARGVPVVGLAENPKHFGARTKVCQEVIGSDCSSVAVVDTLIDLGRRLAGKAVLIPCTDPSVAVLSRERARLSDWFWLPLAPNDVVETLMDKVLFAEHAKKAGLSVPPTMLLATRSEAEEAAAGLTYPSLLKPALKSASWASHTSAKGFAVGSPGELLEVYDRVAGWTPQLLVQQWVEGGEDSLYSCNCYFDRSGQPLVTFVARKVRQWPPDIGTSASGEECRNDEVLAEALRVFGSVDYHGLAYLEMKRDARSGSMFIIEPNVGRPTGRSAIAEAGGVDLVLTAYCDASGLPLPSAREQHYRGTKWLDVRRDLQAAVVARRRGEMSLGEWVRSLRGPKAHAIWSRTDPLPFVVDVTHSVTVGARMLARRLVGSQPARTAAPNPSATASVQAEAVGLVP